MRWIQKARQVRKKAQEKAHIDIYQVHAYIYILHTPLGDKTRVRDKCIKAGGKKRYEYSWRAGVRTNKGPSQKGYRNPKWVGPSTQNRNLLTIPFTAATSSAAHAQQLSIASITS